MKNRVLTMIIIILIAITLILTAAVFVWNYLDNKNNPDSQANATAISTPEPLTPKQVKENTIFVKGILTNLSTPKNVISMDLAFEVENAKTKEDFEYLLDSVVKATIISILNDTTVDQINGAKGTDSFASTLLNKLNPLFKNGKIKRIDITNKVIS